MAILVNREVFTNPRAWLIDDHIDHFAKLMHRDFDFALCESWKVQLPQLIEPLNPDKTHIQLLISYDGKHYSNNGHWVCSYYNEFQIYIFDSLPLGYLHPLHRVMLQRLYPFYSFERNPPIFPYVQRQHNSYDCGLFAAAYATSLLFSEWPGNIRYDIHSMRQHMLYLLENNVIVPFPKMCQSSSSQSKHNFNEIPQKIPNQFSSSHSKHNFNKIPQKKQDKFSSSQSKNNANEIPQKKQNKSFSSQSKHNSNKIPQKIQESENYTMKSHIQNHEHEKHELDNQDNSDNIKSVPQNKKSNKKPVNGKIDIDNEKTRKSQRKEHNVSSQKRKYVFATHDEEQLPSKRRKNQDFTNIDADENKSVIREGGKLTDKHMQQFKMILGKCSDYDHRDTLFLQRPCRIRPVHHLQKHIQILHSRTIDHWVCSYYDGRDLYIYDSLNKGTLCDDQKTFLQRLYPFRDITDQSTKFPLVQQQPNGIDCGIFAIAFATSLLFNRKPEYVKYNHSQMRSHLYKIMDTNQLQHFPTAMCPSAELSSLPLDELRKKEKQAFRKRVLRERMRSDKLPQENAAASRCKDFKTDDHIVHSTAGVTIPIPESSNRSNDKGQTAQNSEFYQAPEADKLESEYAKLKKNERNQSIRNKNSILLSQKCHSNKKKKMGIAKKLIFKYTRMHVRQKTVRMKLPKEDYVKKIMELVEGDSEAVRLLEAERVIKWCMTKRQRCIYTMKKSLHVLKMNAELLLSRANDGPTTRAKIINACGKSKHTSGTEAYFYDTAYTSAPITKAIVMNKRGQAVNILPVTCNKKGREIWTCDDTCRISDEFALNNLRELLGILRRKKLSTLPILFNQQNLRHSIDKLGHIHNDCYTAMNTCGSIFIPLQFLSPHFPRIRYMKQLLYKLKRLHQELAVLDRALNTGHLDLLYEIIDSMKKKGNIFHGKADIICLDEDKIQEKYKKAFIAYTKRKSDNPIFPCTCCQKLCYRRDIVIISQMKNPITTKIWKDLQHYLNENEHLKSDYVCDYCLKRLRNGILPPRSIMNNLNAGPIPQEIADLNEYSKILIQRAKCFQTVQRMGTIMKKNLPASSKIEQVKGCTLHLPLPIEETLKKICPSTDAINKNHELFILVRGLPTKKKVVWENIVDVKKVFNALITLKRINPLYKDISLPTDCEHLLPTSMHDIEFHVESQDKDNNEQSSQDNAEMDDDMDSNANGVNNDKENGGGSQHPALLTQILDSDRYNESYTIYPLYNKRKYDTSTNLYQMLKVQAEPLDNRIPNLDLLCFPDLYPYGINGQHQERPVPLPSHEYIKLRLLSADPRFRLNHQYLFYLSNDATIRQLSSGIYHTLNILNPREKYTASSYLQRLSSGALEANLSTIFDRLRNSAEFWKKPRNDLYCMTQHYGPATWFLTLSPAEWLWTDMIDHIRKVNSPYLDKLSANAVIAADPVTASRFIENAFQAMLTFILSDAHPIGKVVHYFWRREYQGRGIPHFHLQLWVEGAPVIGVNTSEEIADFIMKYVTCRIPDKYTSPTLHRRVTTHQTHTHNSYCLRKKVTKSGDSSTKCRFGFSRPTTEEFVLRDPAVSIAGRRNLRSKTRLYDLPRNEREGNINDYNPALLSVWEGNMDLQFIGESSTLLTRYCTKYITKPEKTKIPETINEMTSTKTLNQMLWSIAFRGISNREIGAMEVADTLLGHSLHGTDSQTTIKWLDIRMIRNRKLKTRQEIENMQADSTNIFCPSLIDTYYPNRPQQLDEISLYEFAKWYEVVKDKPVREVECYEMGSLYVKRRKRAYLLNHYKYDINTQPENYFHGLLLLFQPWRDVDELKNNCSTYQDSFNLRKDQLLAACQYHEKITEIEKGIQYLEEQIQKHLDDDSNNETQNPVDIPDQCNPTEIQNVMRDFRNMDAQVAVDIDLEKMIEALNSDQKRIFDKITNVIQSKDDILRLYVSGEGGTGKSFLIDVIRCWMKQELSKETAVTAPTGIAAFNIKGLTIHKFFQLPVQHGSTPKYVPLSDEMLKILRNDLKDVELIIIDEVSMISNITLMYINLRLIEIFNTADSGDGWFGGKHILLFGDLLQLPPVLEKPAYVKLSTEELEKHIGSMGNVNLWESLFSYEELTMNMRQQNDQTYRDLLGRIRVGMMTNDDLELLESRKIPLTPTLTPGERVHELCDYIKSLPDDTVCLLSTREQCRILNTAMLEKINAEEIKLVATDIVQNSRIPKKKANKALKKIENDESRTAGVPYVITIKIGAKIMLRRNIDVTLGLVNGAIGTVISVTRSVHDGNVDSILVRLNSGGERVIEPINVNFELLNDVYVTRKQFPIQLSYGITVHKSQGLSLRCVVVDVGMTIFSPGQTYVALSRVTSLEGLHLINFDPHSVKTNRLAIIEYNRFRALYRPDLPQIPISEKRWHKVWDRRWTFQEVDISELNSETQQLHQSNMINGLENQNRVFSYANAVVQCLIHSSPIRKGLINQNESDLTELKNLIKSYTDGREILSTVSLRHHLGEEFCVEKEQDPAFFFDKLSEKSLIIRDVTKHILKITEHCTYCQYSRTNEELNFVLRLPIVKTPKSVDINEFINKSCSHWHENISFCENCKRENSFRRKLEVLVPSQIVIIQLQIFPEKAIKAVKNNFLIKSIPTAKINLDGNNYRVNSAIFHEGGSITDAHYKTMIRDKKSRSGWIEIDDLQVQKRHWPNNAKGVFMLFLEKMYNSKS